MISPIPLPYRADALEPWISCATTSLHYQLYQRYIQRTVDFFRAARFVPATLSDALDYAVNTSGDLELLHNVQQALNHELYWESMAPNGGGSPVGDLAGLVRERWQNYGAFAQEWIGAAAGLFGSGWVWLGCDPESGDLEILSAPNSDQPWQMGCMEPLLVMDVWEHAFIFDYPMRKNEYTQAFLQHLVNWRFAEANLEAM